jgi:hypothetical protein
MNNLKTTDLGGFPLKLDDFRFINNAVLEAFKGMMSMYDIADSHAVILSGCTRTSSSGTTSIAQGYISIGGEICFVPAHSYPDPTLGQNEYWMIDVSYDLAGYKHFQNTDPHNTYEVRVGKIQVSNIVPAGFTTYDNTKNVFTLIKEGVGMFPGIIVMWGGNISAIPNGWRLCDGTGGAPNLRDRFIVGAGDTYNIDDTGGQDSFTIDNSNLPAHSHTATFEGDALGNHNHGMFDESTGSGGDWRVLNAGARGENYDSIYNLYTEGVSAGTPTGTVTVDNGGGVATPTAIDNKPLFYALAFIQKV